MRAPLCRLGPALLLLGACGTLAEPGAGDRELPTGRGGPFRLVEPAEMNNQLCALVEVGARLDDPSPVRVANGVALYFTYVRGDTRAISRSLLPDGRLPAGLPAQVYAPSVPWEGDRVEAPSVAQGPNNGLWMAYAAAGGLGVSTSSDGVAWAPPAAPALVQDVAAGEDTPLRAPSLTRDPSGGWVLLYESAASIWMARAGDDLRFVRVDADPSTPRRDPVLAPAGERDGGTGGYRSGAVGDPYLTVEQTAAGRPLWRLYFTARTTLYAVDGGLRADVSVGVAGSFDGLRFDAAALPALATRVDPTASAPAMLADGPVRTLLYAGGNCSGASQRRGIRVALAP
jgi:hypothetical protein